MTILLLAGTGDARKIAWELTGQGRKAVASLAGVTRDPDPLPIPTRTGGFGGEDGFRGYLSEAKITAVIDATHPFASRITERTARVCAQMGLPYLYYLRPGWTAGAYDNWTMIDREEDAANHIPADAVVFLGTGRQTLDRFANLEGRRVICRQIDPPTAPFPFEGGEFLIGRPPFPVAREKALFADLGIDWIVVKNAGGEASRTKLDAAAQLHIPVLMIRRPDPPAGIDIASDMDAVRAWLAAL